MKGSAIALALFLLATTPRASASVDERVAQIPADLALVETAGPYRLLAFQVCSPEHCWNDFFLQELGMDEAPDVVCSVPITEFNGSSDVVVQSARRPSDSVSELELSLVSSHGIFKPYTVALKLERGCKYRLSPAVPEAA